MLDQVSIGGPRLQLAGFKVAVVVAAVETWTVDFHPTSMQVASGSQSGHINLWDANTGKKLQSLETKGKFAMSVAYVSLLVCCLPSIAFF